jgi:hypothetical protein
MRAGIRHAAMALAAVALGLLAVRPERRVTIRPTDALLVTPGATAAGVRRLVDSLKPAHVLSLAGADSLPDPGYIARRYGDARLHVVGWGLRDDEWRALGSAPASVHAEPLPPGFAAVSWPRSLTLGDAFQVTGTVTGHSGAHVFVGDRGGPLDSARLGPDGAFALQTQPRATGPQTYALWTPGAPAETIGLVVTPPPSWRTLIVTAAPSFEAAALRDLLAARGSPVTWRAGVSRDRTRSEFVNGGTAAIAGHDLLVIDGRTLLALSGGERDALLRTVRDSGLGVLLLPDDALEGAARTFGFSLAPDTALTERLVRPRAAQARPPATPVPAEPFSLRETFGVRTALWGAMGEALAQVRPAGAGRLAVTLVTAPSRWSRAGERDAFAGYWAPLLAAVAGTPREDRWTVGGGAVTRIDEPVEIAVRTRRVGPLAVVAAPSGASDTVYLAPDDWEPGRWLGRYWPREPGWHAITGAADAGFHVASAAAWPGVRAAERLAATSRRAAAAPATTTERPPQTARRTIPLGWWLAMFALAAGVLWADRRRAYIRAMPRTAVAVLLLGLLGCAKSPEKLRTEVSRCSAVNTQAELIALCLISEHDWKEGPADSAGRLEARRLDSVRTAQEEALWNADSVNHKAALKQCGAGNDPRECLLVRFGWDADRATRAADSIWARNADRHLREVRSCARGKNPIASCLMLNYKWNATRAMATEDSVRRARMR